MKILVLVLMSFSSFLMAADEESRVFKVKANASLDVEHHKGELKIRPAAGDTIEVSYRIYYKGEDISDSEKTELLNAVEVQIVASERNVSIEVDYDQANDIFDAWKRRNRTMPYVDFDIFVPEDANISVESHKGNMDIDAPSGEIEIESHKGKGTLRNVRSDLEIETHKGDFNVEIAELADLEVETHKGNVTIDILNAADFRIEGESHKGALNVNGRNVKIAKEKRESILTYSEGSAKNEISLETHKGDITLNFKN